MSRVPVFATFFVLSGCRMVNPAFDGADTEAVAGSTEASSTSPDPGSVSATSDASSTDDSLGGTSFGPIDTTGTTGTAASTGSSRDTSSSSDGTTGDACDAAPAPPTECDPACDMCNDGTCIVVCNDEQPCQDQTLMCPGPGPCLFGCRGTDVCNGATLICQGEDSCAAECSGVRACQQAEVQCAGGPCSVTCGPQGSTRVCAGMLVGCGSADTQVTCEVGQAVPPALTPSSGCACESMGC